MDPRSARDVLRLVAESFSGFGEAGTGVSDPLGWPGYPEKQRELDMPESVLCGQGRVRGIDCALIAFDFRYFGGSLGSRTGDLLVRAFDEAVRRRLPVVSLVASGGSRMQEGMLALLQMQRIAGAAARLRAAELPHVTVLRDPVAGGAWASLASSADVVFAVPDATVCFAGARVRGGSDDTEAFTSNGKLALGQVHRLVELEEVGATLAALLPLLKPTSAEAPDVPDALGHADLPESGAEAVRRARAAERPRADAYLDDYFDNRLPLSSADPGMLCGFGSRHGNAIAYAAQAGTANSPAGFRAAARLVRLADRLRLPILTLVDTPGAAHDAQAERDGIGPAIAELFTAVADASVPITTLVIGEGGSGGALALTSHTRVWITPDAYFSVIAPESANAILKREPAELGATIDQLRLRPQDLLELGVVHGIAQRSGA
ncbi:carboxyl transferase domain-containing protein [Allokutzneria albata]|uniref:acetyl-CoA carboxytransferase n=1 Tax=Allokutzneria albata TaxID=211114 RepID=A0A1G9TIY4_ALLAB|nr:carboxyl transferase domain-containing protein [Allokutzneria albata]SDM47681.1 acetyl-CoA carboxylase carboxyl transferase subunit beta [Allokutzneria albata]